MRTRPSPLSPAVALNGIWALLLLTEVAFSLADVVVLVSKTTVPITDEMLSAPTPPNEEARLAELNG